MSRLAILAAVVTLAAADVAAAQGPMRSFLFGRPASNCPGGVCPSPGMASPPAFQPVPAIPPQAMPAAPVVGEWLVYRPGPVRRVVGVIADVWQSRPRLFGRFGCR